jgi:hypothetical protein
MLIRYQVVLELTHRSKQSKIYKSRNSISLDVTVGIGIYSIDLNSKKCINHEIIFLQEHREGIRINSIDPNSRTFINHEILFHGENR